jgi:hypothetical protein
VNGPAARRFATSSTKAMQACVRSCFGASSAFGWHVASLGRWPIYVGAGLEPSSVMHKHVNNGSEWNMLIVIVQRKRTCLVASALIKMCWTVIGPMPSHDWEPKFRTNIILIMVRTFWQDCSNLVWARKDTFVCMNNWFAELEMYVIPSWFVRLKFVLE